MKRRIRRIAQQSVPRTYRTRYGRVNADGTETPMFCVWKMWAGHCYKVDRIEMAA